MSFWKTIKSFFNKESVISVTETPIVNTVVPKKATPAIVAETFDNMMAEAKTQATAQKKKRYYKHPHIANFRNRLKWKLCLGGQCNVHKTVWSS